MSERPRASVRVLCALLALALGLPAFFAPAATALPTAAKASCCCGTGACCTPTSACCVKEGDRQAPDPGPERQAKAPEPRLFEDRSASGAAIARSLAAASPRELAPAASPSEDRLHLRQAVFRT